MTNEVSPRRALNASLAVDLPFGLMQVLDIKGDRLIGLQEVLARLGMSRSWLFRQIQLGLFPRPAKLGRANRWSEAQTAAIRAAHVRHASRDEIARLVRCFGGARG